MDALNNWQTESIKRIADELWDGQYDLPLYPPRRMRTVGRAAIAKRAEVMPTDIGQPEVEAPKPRIGFIH